MQRIPRLLSYLLFWTLMCKALKLQWNTVLFIWPLRSKVNDRNNNVSGFHANMPLQERVEPPHFWPNMQIRLLTHCSHSELKQVQCVMCFRRRDDSGYTHTHTHTETHTLTLRHTRNVAQASVWIQPLNDLRWPNTWEETMTTPPRTSEEAKHQRLYWLNQSLP